MEVKPNASEILPPNDTIYTKPKVIFANQTITESMIDTAIIPKRQKHKASQITVAPIVIPITTNPFQTFEQRPEQRLENQKVEQPETIAEPIVEIRPRPTPQTSHFFIQIGAFVSENSANRQLNRFKNLHPNLNAQIVFDPILNLYKVQINGTNDLSKITQTLEIVRKNFPDAFITSRKSPGTSK